MGIIKAIREGCPFWTYLSWQRMKSMLKSGVIDPTKVTRTALKNAGSNAELLLTTEALVTDIPEKEKQPAHPPMPDYS